MNRKQALLAAALAGCFFAGCLVGGAVVFFRTVPTSARTLALLSLDRTGNEAYVKYRYGSYAVAKAALLEHADNLTRSRTDGAMRTDAGADFDLALTYGRLALAAERVGESQDSARYMALATQALAKPRREAGAREVRMSVERLDAAWDRRLAGATK
jgi:hypothetical protein